MKYIDFSYSNYLLWKQGLMVKRLLVEDVFQNCLVGWVQLMAHVWYLHICLIIANGLKMIWLIQLQLHVLSQLWNDFPCNWSVKIRNLLISVCLTLHVCDLLHVCQLFINLGSKALIYLYLSSISTILENTDCIYDPWKTKTIKQQWCELNVWIMFCHLEYILI